MSRQNDNGVNVDRPSHAFNQKRFRKERHHEQKKDESRFFETILPLISMNNHDSTLPQFYPGTVQSLRWPEAYKNMQDSQYCEIRYESMPSEPEKERKMD
jgi:hypothetical protein